MTKAGIALAVLALALPASAQAADFAVNTTADTNDAQGCLTLPTCSLREALARAGAAAGGDTISVPAGHYTLSLGELAYGASDDLTVAGAGARATAIDGTGASRVFSFGGGNVTVRALTITGGNTLMATPAVTAPGDGGGIQARDADSLTLDHVAVTGNTAQLNGGGIAIPPESTSAAPLTVTDSTIAGNSVTGGTAEGQGGGIYALGNLTLTNSTVSGNSVSNPGANVGGGVATIASPSITGTNGASIVNSTIAGNSVTTGSGGGLSGGGASLTAALEVRNSIIAGNTGGNCTLTGTMLTVTSDHDLTSDASCGFTDPGSIQADDPKLGPLADNGGPTDTRALLTGSPAFDAGTGTGCPATDQRGTARPQGKTCDIGAFELVPRADLAVTIDAPETGSVGRQLTYGVTVVNNGPQPAAGVSLSAVIPDGVESVGASGCGGSPLTCSVGDLAPGASRTFAVSLTPTEPGALALKASVSGSYDDPDASNDEAAVSVAVEPVADLAISEHASHRLLTEGENVTFTLTIRNHGPSRATGVYIYDRHSRGLKLLSAKGAKKCSGRRLIRCDLAPIGAGKKRRVKLKMAPRAAHVYRNNAEVFSPVDDPDLTNNRAVQHVRVLDLRMGL